MTVRLVLADDHPLMLDALESLFSSKEDLEVQARCSNGEEALAAVERLRPDILLLNLHMPKMDGLAVVRALNEEGLPTRVVVLTAGLDEREALDCMRLGVAGIVLKEMPSHLLLQCVRKVAVGDVWVEKDSFTRALKYLLRREAGLQSLASRLSSREMQVMKLCAQGLGNSEIAKRLSLSEGTVKAHLHHVYHKLEVEGRVELGHYAHQNGLV
jgi:DNA-binding NarL/FixJ family response regulator